MFGRGLSAMLAPILFTSSIAAIHNVRTFGAKGDNATDDTAAFVAAIAAVTTDTHGTVLIPTGGVYLIAPINLTSNIDFYIESGARIVGVMDFTKWPIIPGAPSYGQGRNHGAHSPRFTSLIHGEHLTNVTIRGDGDGSVLDGQGQYWWTAVWNATRGHLLEIMYTNGLVVRDIKMVDSPFWNNHIYDCDNVHFTRVSIEAPPAAPNTDGWDPDSSRNVLIEDSSYTGGDDCVAIKSGWDCFGIDYAKPSKGIHIRNITCHGRFAGIAIGSEMSGGVEDVLVEDVRFTLSNGAAHIKTSRTRGGYVKDVIFRNVIVDGLVDNAILVAGNDRNGVNPSCPRGWKPPALSVMSNYSFINIDGTNSTVRSFPYSFTGLNGSLITGIRIENVTFPKGRGDRGDGKQWNCANVEGTATDVAPSPPCKEIKETSPTYTYSKAVKSDCNGRDIKPQPSCGGNRNLSVAVLEKCCDSTRECGGFNTHGVIKDRACAAHINPQPTTDLYLIIF